MDGLLQRGSTGDAVRELQTTLKSSGFYLGPIDGIYGPKTADAVREFQRMAGVAVDGIVGPETQSAIQVQLGPTVPLPELPNPGGGGPTPGLNPGVPREPEPGPGFSPGPGRAPGGGSPGTRREGGLNTGGAALVAAATAVGIPALYSLVSE